MIAYPLLLSLAILDHAAEQPTWLQPPQAIYRVWMHSIEEDTAREQVYRPVGYPFPPARGRDGFEIKAKGGFVAHEIGIDDGPEKVAGKWTCEEANVIAVTFPDAKPKEILPGEFIPPPGPRTLRVLSCDKTVLRLKKPEPKKAGR